MVHRAVPLPAGVELVRELDPQLVPQLCATYEREWWCQGRSEPDVVRALSASVAVAALVDTERQVVDALLAGPELAQATVIDLDCRLEMAPFYERWGFEVRLPTGDGCRMVKRVARDAGP